MGGARGGLWPWSGELLIPANLGALEASSLAAAAAVGASGGGAALALARRLRGLFWAGLGLAIYPRGVRPSQPAAPGTPQVPATRPGATLLYFPEGAGQEIGPTARLAGLAIAERVVRSAVRAGYNRIVISTERTEARTAALLRRLAASVPEVTLVSGTCGIRTALDSLADQRQVTAIGGGLVVSPALLQQALTLRPATGEILDVAPGADWPESGVLRLGIDPAQNVERLRSAMPYGIFAFALANCLPGIIVLAAIGSHVYWISLVVKLKALMGHEDALAA